MHGRRTSMAKLGRCEKRAMLSKSHEREGMRRAQRVLEHLDMKGKRDYLELGCGGGHVTRHMATECGLQCTGTDVDPDMVEAARSRSQGIENVKFLTADATDLPFEDASFDLVLSFGILHHIGEWPRVIEEVSRVLRPGGDYVLGDFAYSRFSKRALAPFVRNYGLYTVDDLIDASRASGLDLAWRSEPRGIMFRYHGLILEKGSQRPRE
jgi:ubiquinone/menaquinone biosynthesis C-methylase UbiE